MDKAQAINDFWSEFGLPVYDENTVPTGESSPELPYLTYNTVSDNFGNVLNLHASLWYRSMSWAEVTKKADEIADFIDYGLICDVDGGYMTVDRGTPFAQRIPDNSDDTIRRILINIQVEFDTEF